MGQPFASFHLICGLDEFGGWGGFLKTRNQSKQTIPTFPHCRESQTRVVRPQFEHLPSETAAYTQNRLMCIQVSETNIGNVLFQLKHTPKCRVERTSTLTYVSYIPLKSCAAYERADHMRSLQLDTPCLSGRSRDAWLQPQVGVPNPCH